MQRAAGLLIAVIFLVGAAHTHATKLLPASDRPANLVKQHVLPDPILTPGAIYSDVTLNDIKQHGFSATVRDVPESVKHQVLRAYGVDPATVKPHEFEIDHVVELACGGSNDPHNLWPQYFHLNVGGRDMGAIEKDKVEKKALAGVRDGSLDLAATQKQLAADWTVLYRKLVAPEFPPYTER
jgi:hypothetical protein